MMQRLHLRIRGRVQGVGFRMAARDYARAHGLCGTVRNLPDESVEIVAEGDLLALREFQSWCYSGSDGAHVISVHAETLTATGEYNDFLCT